MRNGATGCTWYKAEAYPRDYYHAPLALYLENDKGEPEQKAIISAGTSDDVRLFSDNGLIYIYAGNDPLGYMGLEVYDINKGKIVADIFIDHGLDYQEYEHLNFMNRTNAMLNHLEF